MRKKHLRIIEFEKLANCYSSKKPPKNFFSNNRPLILELACGKGAYVLAMAKIFPKKNFIGIDKKGVRLWHGAQKALAEKLDNATFFRANIENLTEYFPEKSIEEIWITFPDPFIKKGEENKRLTSSKFLEIYKKIIKPRKSIHLKTDSDDLFIFSIQSVEKAKGLILKKVDDLHNSLQHKDIFRAIVTDYEKKHVKAGKKIHYFEFSL